MNQAGRQVEQGKRASDPRGWNTHDNLLKDDMCSALMVFADEVSQNARNDGRGRQDQGVVQREPCSKETLGRVGDALCCVHLDKFAGVILQRTGKMLTDHSSLGGGKLVGEARCGSWRQENRRCRNNSQLLNNRTTKRPK